MKFKEADVRDCVRSMFPRNVEWNEPSFGSSVGKPDCEISGIPIELKMWEETRKGVKAVMRPAQIRWHTMHARNGGKSAILYGVAASDHKAGLIGLYILPGKFVPKTNYDWDNSKEEFIGYLKDHPINLRNSLLNIICGDFFWS